MERSEYLKNYRNQNKEKIKKYNEKYYDKKRKLKINKTDDDNTNDKKINEEINKIPNLNFGDRMKLIRAKKRDELIKKMKDEGKLSDDSDDSEDEKNENSEISV